MIKINYNEYLIFRTLGVDKKLSKWEETEFSV